MTKKPEYEVKFVGPWFEQLVEEITELTKKGLCEVFDITQYYLSTGQRLRYSIDKTSKECHYVLAAPKTELSNGGKDECETPLNKEEFDAYLQAYGTDLVIKKQRMTIPLIIRGKELIIDESCKNIQESFIRCDIDQFSDIRGLSRAEIETNDKNIFLLIQEVLQDYQQYNNIIILPKQLTNKTLAKIQFINDTEKFLNKLDVYVQQAQTQKKGHAKKLVGFLEQSKKSYSTQLVG